MANFFYKAFRTRCADTGGNYNSGNVKIDLCDVTYSADRDVDDFHNDISGGSIVATSGNLTGKSWTDFILDADDVTFVALTGDDVESIVMWVDSGTSSTSPLVLFIDSFPTFSPTGDDATVQWSNGASKIGKM